MDTFAAPTPYWYPQSGAGFPLPKGLHGEHVFPLAPWASHTTLPVAIDELMRPYLSERGIMVPAEQTVQGVRSGLRVEIKWAATWLDDAITLIGLWQRWDIVTLAEQPPSGYSYQQRVSSMLVEVSRIPRHAYTYWRMQAGSLVPVHQNDIQASAPMERVILLGAMGAD